MFRQLAAVLGFFARRPLLWLHQLPPFVFPQTTFLFDKGQVRLGLNFGKLVNSGFSPKIAPILKFAPKLNLLGRQEALSNFLIASCFCAKNSLTLAKASPKAGYSRSASLQFCSSPAFSRLRHSSDISRALTA